jgi:hypothetical protein
MSEASSHCAAGPQGWAATAAVQTDSAVLILPSGNLNRPGESYLPVGLSLQCQVTCLEAGRGQRQVLAGPAESECQLRSRVNFDDSFPAVSTSTRPSSHDPEETPTDLTSPPRSGQSHPYSGPAEGDASARSTARNCGYDRRKPSGIRSTQGDRSLTLSRSRSRGCAGTGAWAPNARRKASYGLRYGRRS